jgi:hypothetical protein
MFSLVFTKLSHVFTKIYEFFYFSQFWPITHAIARFNHLQSISALEAQRRPRLPLRGLAGAIFTRFRQAKWL